MNKTARYWAIIPAAGIGSRMGVAIPKQYLQLRGRSVIENAITQFIRHPRISGVVVVLSAEDVHWPTLSLASTTNKLQTTVGGEERCHSVVNGLDALQEQADANDWILVHDAARPCIHAYDIDKLIGQLSSHPVGGLLGAPVSDTMKRTNSEGDVVETVNRESLWRALTPQMFRYSLLRKVLTDTLNAGELVTDEAAAMERAGHTPRLVEGRPDNIKITRPEDLALAEMYLARQEEEVSCV